MADPVIENLGQNIKPIAGGNVLVVIIIIGLIGLVILGILFIVMFLKYKHKFRIIKMVNDNQIIIDDTAKIYKNQDGIEIVKLRKLKLEAPYPPDDAIAVTERGRYSMEARYSPDMGFEYIFPDNKKHQISTEAFTTNQKSFMVYQHKKAQIDRKTNIMDVIQASIPYVALAVIVISLFVFWNDMAAPLAEARKDMIRYKQLDLELAKEVKDINSRVQRIEAEVVGIEENAEVPD